MMAYSDFPIPEDWPTFLPHRFIAKYLNMYCDNFDLRKHIKFNRKVIDVSPEVDASGTQTGRWEVVTQKCRRRQPPGSSSHPIKTSIRGDSPASTRSRNMSPARPGMAGLSSSFGDMQLQGESGVDPRARGRSPAPSTRAWDDPNFMTTPPVNGYDYIPSSPNVQGFPIPPPPKDLPDLPGSVTGLGMSPDAPSLFGEGRSPSVSVTKMKAETFDFVIVATGHHWKPRLPEFVGMEKFKGGMMHSHSYRLPYPFKDSRVLIVGVGNSGMDIAAELSHHARQVILSTRSGTWVLPRFTLFGLPTDHLSSRATSKLPRPLVNFAIETITRLQSGNMERFGLKPDHNLLQSHPTINGEVLDRIGAGKILVRPNVARFTSGTTVEFDDGTTEEIDTVIYCTGYKIEHPFLDSASILGQTPSSPTNNASSETPTSPKLSNRVRLYKNIFPVNHKNIAFVGLVQPNGAVMPVSEMQSRWVARIFSGNTPPLPPPKELDAAVEKAFAENPYLQKERHTIQVDYVTYMDELADAIGCKPDLWKLWKQNWMLATYVTFGPAVPAQYRLEGPGMWKGAEGVIADACKGYDFRKVVGYQAVAKLRDGPPSNKTEE
ncbi:hypothetical protein HDV05_003132 [Chytridiales sp. JEL 0842]|nr:hypothetical protein HDV05_003132 [Chytridiales sp. JEL 0842]